MIRSSSERSQAFADSWLLGDVYTQLPHNRNPGRPHKQRRWSQRETENSRGGRRFWQLPYTAACAHAWGLGRPRADGPNLHR